MGSVSRNSLKYKTTKFDICPSGTTDEYVVDNHCIQSYSPTEHRTLTSQQAVRFIIQFTKLSVVIAGLVFVLIVI